MLCAIMKIHTLSVAETLNSKNNNNPKNHINSQIINTKKDHQDAENKTHLTHTGWFFLCQIQPKHRYISHRTGRIPRSGRRGVLNCNPCPNSASSSSDVVWGPSFFIFIHKIISWIPSPSGENDSVVTPFLAILRLKPKMAVWNNTVILKEG